MRRLMLLRHAKTETDAPSGKDIDRRLDERGQSDAAEIGAWMTRHPPLPELVLVSTAVRARQTWDIVAAMLAETAIPAAQHMPGLYGAGPTQLLEAIRDAAVEDPQHLMIVAHNPGLHELALGLTGSGDPTGLKVLADNLPTSGLAVIDFAVDSWHEVSFRTGKLELFVSPKLLKDRSAT